MAIEKTLQQQFDELEQKRDELRHGAEIMSRFISACIMASAPQHFSVSSTHCLKHLAA
jgi:hypothetical protein